MKMKKEILENMAQYIDHGSVAADATREQHLRLCDEAKKYHFASVISNSSYLPLIREALKDSDVKVGGTAGYPLGACSTAVKVFEAKECALLGADELDTVMNIGYFLNGDYDCVVKDLKAVVNEFKSHGDDKVVKVIIETSLIGKENIQKAVECVIASRADFVKTSSGYGKAGAEIGNVIEMCKAAQGKIRVKAAGGIRKLEDAYKYVEAGATRLGGQGGVIITDAAKEALKNM